MVPRVLMALVMSALPALASDICLRAADLAAQRHDIPRDVMRAITLTETGRRADGQFSPWPWTVNMEGAGHWFDDLGAALAFIAPHHARGARSYDVGCFQLNWRWHGENFPDLETMFDPDRNADYAARYLRGHYEAFGDWTRAAGRYHSGTPEYATRYAARFAEIRASLGPLAEVEMMEPPRVFGLRQARGPLLTRARGPLFGGGT
ncbi:transglycosylase SLT domain-containing protein [Pontivivens insulae]|uniref:Transglycosylase SLT domain-containing protein n=1 Tax=Pontivivens insulae TaxID=1639689 RepID=A0A2R8A9G1_9RHOB|nr:transglycosylase SLT domain-containing protein [Pontivivens insulae]RED12778.1 transglycosylase-like protein with SLT domain [Pontivivens insulae]SPF28869.1 hypothetical protein POI8812_01172 [Pontivivens insulae]